MRRVRVAFAAVLLACSTTAATAQIRLVADVSAGPSLSFLGAGGEATVRGVPLPVGSVEYPAAVGVDARARLGVWSGPWGVRLGAGYLSASDVFDGASLLNQEGVTLQFAVTTLEIATVQPIEVGGVVADLVVGVGPELRALVSERSPGSGLLRYLGDIRQGHVAVGGSLALLIPVGAGVRMGPEVRGGYALTPFSDDTLEILGGAVRLDGDFRFHHISGGLTVAF